MKATPNESNITRRFYDRQGERKARGDGPKSWWEIDPDDHRNYPVGTAKHRRPDIYVGVQWTETARIPRPHRRKCLVVEIKNKAALLELCDTETGERNGRRFEITSLKHIHWWPQNQEGGVR